jgi:hypothetical protein
VTADFAIAGLSVFALALACYMLGRTSRPKVTARTFEDAFAVFLMEHPLPPPPPPSAPLAKGSGERPTTPRPSFPEPRKPA